MRTHLRSRKAWSAMRARCFKVTHDKYRYYGGRGITVCQSWQESFDNFYADMGDCPEGYSLDRIDTDGDYEPGNCRWASKVTQMNNTRYNVRTVVNGEDLTLGEIAEKYGVLYGTVWERYRKGWRGERLVQPTMTYAEAQKASIESFKRNRTEQSTLRALR